MADTLALFPELESRPADSRTTGVLPSQRLEEFIAAGHIRAAVAISADQIQPSSIDLRVDRTWRIGAMDLTAFVDVQNVYLNDSVVTYFYSYDFTQRSAFKSLPLIPSIGIRGVL